MDDQLLPLPSPDGLWDWCAGVRHTAAAYASSAQGLRGYTSDQRVKLQAAFHQLTHDRDVRIGMLNLILEKSALTLAPFTSFNDLSEAQASGLITALFGPKAESNAMLESAYLRLEQLRAEAGRGRAG